MILLADGDMESRTAFQSFFERRGWGCTVAADAEDFRHEIERNGYDMVIADSDMPGLSSVLLLGELYRKKPSQALLVIGENLRTNDHKLRLLRSGPTDVITKPVDWSWLERCVEQAVCAKRLEDQERATYRFVTNERTEMRFTCRQLAEAQAIALPIVNRLIASDRIAENDALKIRLAVQEALLNAVEHGNLELESKWKEEWMSDGTDKFSCMRRERLADPVYANRLVTIVSYFDGEFIEITLSDEGSGFAHQQVISANAPQNISCFGRGLTLMMNAVDEIRYGSGGSEVTLRKKLHFSK
jgi:anti-sigma regulatory factor (Ser/Thr protein kinase)